MNGPASSAPVAPRRLALLCVALAMSLALSGCLMSRDDAPGVPVVHCLRVGPQEVRAAATEATDDEGLAGAPGRMLALRLAEAPSQPALAAWSANGTVLFAAGVADASGGLSLRVARSALLVLAVADADGSAWMRAIHVPPGKTDVAVALAADTITGDIPGTWEQPYAIGGAGRSQWQPTDLPLAGPDLARLLALDLTLQWTNGPTAAGDFGIAAGPYGAQQYHYTNAAYQTTLGPQVEERTLTAEDARVFGWGNETQVRVGPSVSTGAYAVAGMPYLLSWSARLEPQVHDGLVCAGDIAG